MNPDGRPSTYNYDLCVEICEKVSLGENVLNILESNRDKYPSYPTWCKWKRENDELFKLYVNSVQDKSESILKEIDDIKQELRIEKLTPSQANVLIQTLKWQAAKFYPKMYGEKVDITSDGEKLQKEMTPDEREKLINELINRANKELK